ncbi:hypothetical protein [Natronomonas sp. LN261]|uniref:hypothetical protein n=1 Tax=Natronomonas sp. LN261 TaxID=2750669 RepID=UPI0015EE8A12|nr:hypothetical protein [Natronomonas sp. LN261]
MFPPPPLEYLWEACSRNLPKEADGVVFDEIDTLVPVFVIGPKPVLKVVERDVWLVGMRLPMPSTVKSSRFRVVEHELIVDAIRVCPPVDNQLRRLHLNAPVCKDAGIKLPDQFVIVAESGELKLGSLNRRVLPEIDL